MTKAILFVCLGNICRSPTAEAVFRKLAAQAGVDVQADSAGTGGWHAGEPPHPPMVAAAKARGYDLSPLRARQITRADFTRFNRIYVMDRKNLSATAALWPGQGPKPELLLSLIPGQGRDEVPDPWYTGEFDLTIDLCEAACRRLVAEMQAQ